MVDEVKTLREASIAFTGVQRQLTLMTSVFAGSVLIELGVLGVLYNKAGGLSDTVNRIDARLENIEKLLAETRFSSQRTLEDLGRIKGALKIADSGGGPHHRPDLARVRIS